MPSCRPKLLRSFSNARRAFIVKSWVDLEIKGEGETPSPLESSKQSVVRLLHGQGDFLFRSGHGGGQSGFAIEGASGYGVQDGLQVRQHVLLVLILAVTNPRKGLFHEADVGGGGFQRAGAGADVGDDRLQYRITRSRRQITGFGLDFVVGFGRSGRCGLFDRRFAVHRDVVGGGQRSSSNGDICGLGCGIVTHDDLDTGVHLVIPGRLRLSADGECRIDFRVPQSGEHGLAHGHRGVVFRRSGDRIFGSGADETNIGHHLLHVGGRRELPVRLDLLFEVGNELGVQVLTQDGEELVLRAGMNDDVLLEHQHPESAAIAGDGTDIIDELREDRRGCFSLGRCGLGLFAHSFEKWLKLRENSRYAGRSRTSEPYGRTGSSRRDSTRHR